MKTIKELRTEQGLTQLEVAYAIGVTPLSVSNWERGVSVPTVAKLRALAKLFGVPSDDIELFEDEDGQDVKRAA